MDASAADFLPKARSLASLRRAAQGCRGCDLWKDATQTVFGEGRARAELEELGRNPARIIPAWRQFVDEHGGSDRPIRGIGEPVWPRRTRARTTVRVRMGLV